MKKRLYRIESGKMLAGVCGGIAEYFDIDPTLVRALWVLFCILGGSGILLYIILAVLIPSEDSLSWPIANPQFLARRQSIWDRSPSPFQNVQRCWTFFLSQSVCLCPRPHRHYHHGLYAKPNHQTADSHFPGQWRPRSLCCLVMRPPTLYHGSVVLVLPGAFLIFKHTPVVGAPNLIARLS